MITSAALGGDDRIRRWRSQALNERVGFTVDRNRGHEFCLYAVTAPLRPVGDAAEIRSPARASTEVRGIGRQMPTVRRPVQGVQAAHACRQRAGSGSQVGERCPTQGRVVSGLTSRAPGRPACGPARLAAA